MSNKIGTPLSRILPAPVYGALKGMVSNWIDADQLILPDARPPPKEEYLTIAEVQEQFKISRFSLWRMIRRGNVQAHKTGPARSSRVLVSKESLINHLANNTITPNN